MTTTSNGKNMASKVIPKKETNIHRGDLVRIFVSVVHQGIKNSPAVCPTICTFHKRDKRLGTSNWTIFCSTLDEENSQRKSSRNKPEQSWRRPLVLLGFQ
jgi:hypothetical protein